MSNKPLRMTKVKNRAKIFFLCSLLLVLCSLPSFAQTAAEMDQLLAAETVSAATAARFVLGSADLLQQGVSGPAAEKAAFEMAEAKGWIIQGKREKVKGKKEDGNYAITLQDAAFLIMKAFDLKGGVMYSLFANPRYAYREMVYQKLIQGSTDQSIKITGKKLLQILDSTLRYTGGPK